MDVIRVEGAAAVFFNWPLTDLLGIALMLEQDETRRRLQEDEAEEPAESRELRGRSLLRAAGERGVSATMVAHLSHISGTYQVHRLPSRIHAAMSDASLLIISLHAGRPKPCGSPRGPGCRASTHGRPCEMEAFSVGLWCRRLLWDDALP